MMRSLKTIFQAVILGFFGGGGLGFVIGFALYYRATIEAKSMEPGQAASYVCGAGKAPFALTMLGAVAGPVIGFVVGGTIAIIRTADESQYASQKKPTPI
jgi:ABC-type nitrate/sulfonate/bicarbonate transport system permease component